jgi:tetratricopeptide (TPR) repeat protein
VTKELGEEICLRLNLKAFITGAISNFGSVYVLTLEAVNTRSGECLGREFAQVGSKEEVLNAIGQTAAGMREKLGESLSSIDRFNLRADRTTSSLEALKMYSLGNEQRNKGKQLDSIPFFKKALEIDPNFATSYLSLGIGYANIGKPKLAAEMMLRAHEFRDAVSEPEKLRISFFYSSFVQGDIDKGVEILELWRNTYPSDFVPLINLSDAYERIGQSAKAISVAREGLRLDPDIAALYGNLMESLISLSRFEEAKDLCRQANERKLDGELFHVFLYLIASCEADEQSIDEQLTWFRGRKDEYLALDLQSSAEAFKGKWRMAQDLSRRAIDFAARSDAKEIAARYAAEQALRIVFWSSGTGLPATNDERLKTVLKTQTNKALNLERSRDVMARAALALAVAGHVTDATKLADQLHDERPKDTLLNELWLPLIRAGLLLQNGKAKEAIEELEITERFERGAEFYPQYLRGLAHLQLNKSKAATREFDKILLNRGEAPLSSIYPLAQLGKAWSLKDKAEYEKFFELWKDADPDMPAIVAARLEFESL